MVTAAVIPKMILVMKPLVAVRDAVVGFTLLRAVGLSAIDNACQISLESVGWYWGSCIFEKAEEKWKWCKTIKLSSSFFQFSDLQFNFFRP